MTISTKEALSQLNIEQVKEKLHQYPGLILDQKRKVRTCREAFSEAEANQSMRVAELLSEIASESNPATGKPMFSNAESRQAELKKRQNNDADYQDYLREKRQAEMALNQAEDELEKLQNEYKSWLFVSDLVSNEVALYAGVAKRDVVREEIEELLNRQKYWPTEKAS